ncbi:cytochrome-c peroxidase [Coralliovum pocilloporae]|uniref:cytochrome-c peroxidase n=1 Tax=Coralliovum pocilloporae TaxID=3066369 RepID=UPI003306C673
MRWGTQSGSGLWRLLACILSAGLLAVSPADSGEQTGTDIREPIQPLAGAPAYPAELVELGRKLFHDTGLSSDNRISCASCHPIELGGMDNRRLSTGTYGFETTVNTPTVFNVGGQFAFARDGRSHELQAMIESVLESPEMEVNWVSVTRRLAADADYTSLLKQSGLMRPDKDDITRALSAYVDTLRTPSRFDRFLKGDLDAITGDEARGYRLFKDLGCISCHQGMGVGGNLYQQVGIFSEFDYLTVTGHEGRAGLFESTGREKDRNMFKVPSLRNVALTAPYFHNGGVNTLDDAIRLMGNYQLGLDLNNEEVRLIALFLDSLTAEEIPQ